MEGVISTRVGYSGGTKEDPSYRSLGDHTETVEIEYDPKLVSYEELLEVFWSSHEPSQRHHGRQYMAAVFYRDEGQKRLAEETLKREAKKRGEEIHTQVLAFTKFFPAESYHQKYYLRRHPVLMDEFSTMYPKLEDFVSSTSAARVNGFLGGNGSPGQLEREIEGYGLSEKAKKRLLELAGSTRK